MSNQIHSHEGFTQDISRDFFRSVYTYMFGALIVSGIVAFWVGTPEFFVKYFVTAEGGLSPIYYVVIFAPVGLGLLIQTLYRKMSLGILTALFVGFSALMGLSLGSVFLVYSGQTIATTFFITAGAFAGMAILGYTTKTDLTKMGSLLYMGFIGIFIAGIVNIWVQSNFMGWVISLLGVVVFTGLTAYYMQRLKSISNDSGLSGIERNKLALVGGLQLYILFINLFMSLLRLTGGRD
ncbi:Bax inhibitor-1/YccA family protein [Crocinitomicaceae bacterium]|jgi:FtsH-binding integral membrane protein|nr:Bax inhibitor-1/YccA family protein [Crocinitomicaceae bacterium]MDG2464033.1 Bax inhibitor-1/YccA family protein [Crocinitomicaceae bacterium]